MATMAEAVVAVASPRPPEPKPVPCPGRPMPDAVKALVYLFLAGGWVSSAGVATATIARRAWGDDSPVVAAALTAAVGALLFTVLFFVAFSLRVLRELRAMGFSLHSLVKDSRRKVSGALVPKMLQHNIGRGMLAWTPFIMLLTAGCLMFNLTVEGSQWNRIGLALVDVGLLGITEISCFFVIPTFALEVWKTQAMRCFMRCDI